MSTTELNISDRLNNEYHLLVESSEPGLKLFIINTNTNKGLKFWLKAEDIESLIECLIIYQDRGLTWDRYEAPRL